MDKKESKPKTATRWSEEKALEWGARQKWIVGANFNPSDASNQLDMWQADTWNPELIDKELGWAEAIGMNTMRVYLHHFPYRDDKEAFLKRYNRPKIYTEYMARGNQSFFDTHLPFAAENNIGMINWGLVDGRSQTKYPWDSWWVEYTAEPELWFHEVFRNDGTPYKQAEVDLIKKLTTEKNK